MSKIFKIEIELVVATDKNYFLELDRYVLKNGKKTAKMKAVQGIPYWCINSKGKIENKNYVLSPSTDLELFGELFKRKQILIPKENLKCQKTKKKKKKSKKKKK